MPDFACVKSVNTAGKQHGKAGVVSSTQTRSMVDTPSSSRAQPLLFTSFIPTFPLRFSPPKITLLPLFEHYFYPVSTAPIINRSQINSKERY